MKAHSEKFLQQRRFYMTLPFLVLPFLTLFFWALGGGKESTAQAKENLHSGFNLELPSAFFTKEDENWNKFDLYEKAERDSLKYQKVRENDPYFRFDPISSKKGPEENSNKSAVDHSFENTLSTSLKENKTDPNEARVNHKLEELYRGLNRKTVPPLQIDEVEELPRSSASNEQFTADVDRLEQMMVMMQENKANDPAMQQIESVLEKILDVQHPERVEEKIRDKSVQHSQQVFPVNKRFKQNDISLLANNSTSPIKTGFNLQTQNGFFGLEEEIVQDQESRNAIEAVVHNTQELMTGSTVKMRLLNDVYVNGKLIPKDQFIYGTCRINGERLAIAIESIRTQNSLFPVSLSAYDLDGLEGIYIPGAIARDVAKQSSNQAIQGFELNSFAPSIGAQAANASIQAAKTLLSKKAKAIKVTVKAGYKVLLFDANAVS